MKNIAIFGGTFNPIHKGHIFMAKKVVEKYDFLDVLYMMPNNMTAYKDNSEIISNNHRFNMVKLACEGLEKIVPSSLDILRGGITYTVDTLRDMKRIYPDANLYFIVGADSFLYVDKWKDSAEIFSMCSLIVCHRESNADILNKKLLELKANNDVNALFLDSDEYKASSTEIRRLLKDYGYANEYLDEKVFEYIRTNKLYVSQ